MERKEKEMSKEKKLALVVGGISIFQLILAFVMYLVGVKWWAMAIYLTCLAFDFYNFGKSWTCVRLREEIDNG